MPSGEVTRLEGEVFGRSPGFFGVDAGLVVAGSVDNEGLTAGAGVSPRSFLVLPGGVVAGLEAGLIEAPGAGTGEAFSPRFVLVWGLRRTGSRARGCSGPWIGRSRRACARRGCGRR